MKTSMRARRHYLMKNPMRKAWTTSGPRCKLFAGGCWTCAAHLHLHLFGRFPYNDAELESFRQRMPEDFDVPWSKILNAG